MHDGVEPLPCGVIVEDDLGELLAVERAVVLEDLLPELGDDRGEGGLAGLDDSPGELVGVDVHRSMLDQPTRDRGLS